jgi:1-deoxyxylulose-5-phosphate synthase
VDEGRFAQGDAMDYVKLGRTGLEVSRLCLGCMTYGTPGRGPQSWSLGEEAARPLIRRAVEAGITFFDTANMYSNGASEVIVGRALKDFARRDEIAIATKVFFPWRAGPNGGGLSRKAIRTAVEDSLRRLGTDYIDLYQIHRWDPATPIEETLEALHDLVKAGMVLYLGASSMSAWQFAKSLYLADRHGWTRFATMQNHYNLLYREEEREMLPLCAAEGVGVLPWSPLARGRLARPWDAATARSESDAYGRTLYAATAESDRKVVEQVERVAAQRGVPMAQVALAWMMAKPGIVAPIVGVSKPGQLDDALAALTLTLTGDEIAALEAPYAPHPVAGHA